MQRQESLGFWLWTTRRGWKRVQRFAIWLLQSGHWQPRTDGQLYGEHLFNAGTSYGLEAVFEQDDAIDK